MKHTMQSLRFHPGFLPFLTRALSGILLCMIPFIPMTSMAGTVTLMQPEDGSLVASSLDPFIAEVSDADGLSSATLYIGEVVEDVWSGSTDIDDAQITADTPDVNAGSGDLINVDGLTPHAHALIRFNNLSTIPSSATILSATLELDCTNPGNLMDVYQLLESWNETSATWNTWSEPGAMGGSSIDTGIDADCTVIGICSIDITAMVQAWVEGTAANYGLVLMDGGDDGVDFNSSETGNGPVLNVRYALLSQQGEPASLTGTETTIDFGPATGLGNGLIYAWDCILEDAIGEISRAAAPAEFYYDISYPEIPELLAPSDGALDVTIPASLQVEVSDPDAGDTLDVTFFGRPTAADAEPFTIIMIPDSQKYVYYNGQDVIWYAQTQWIADNKVTSNIVFVTHVGDIVETVSDSTQWSKAVSGMAWLDSAAIPYGIAPGNHDLIGYADPSTFNAYFPSSKYDQLSWYGGYYLGNENSYQLFSAGGIDFIALHLAFQPTAGAITWANSILQAYPDRKALLTTHGYLDIDASRNVYYINSTEYIWTDLIEPNSNVHFVLCGHMHGEARRTDVAGGAGFEHEVHQLLADYQDMPSGGDGYLRIMRFVPAENKVYVQTYSPWFDTFKTDPESQFVLDFPMYAFEELGAASLESNSGTATLDWSGMNFGSTYQWFVRVTDSTDRTSESPVWSFTTMNDPGNTPPVAVDGDYTIDEDNSASITLSASDVDPWDLLSYSITVPTQHGNLSGTAPDLTYIPYVDFNGSDGFTFSVDDGRGGVDSGVVTINITAVNDPPAAPTQVEAVAGDGKVALSWQPASDPDGDVLTYTVLRNAAPVFGPSSDLFFLDAAVVNGTEYSYVIRVEDGNGGLVDSAAVSATPDAFDPNAYVVQEPTIIVGTLSGESFSALNPAGEGAQTLTEAKNGVFQRLEAQYVLQTPVDPATINGDIEVMLDVQFSTPDDGSWEVLAWNVQAGTWDHKLSMGSTSEYAFDLAPADYLASDGNIQIVITDAEKIKKEAADQIDVNTLYAIVLTGEPNLPPVAEPGTIETDENTALNLVLSATDSDDGPLPLSYRILSGPDHGVLSGTAPALTYTPDPDYNGSDSFTFVANDGMQDSAPATVSITVNPINDAPVAYDQELSTEIDVPVSFTLGGSDADADLLTYQIMSGPVSGTLSGTAPELTYTPDAGFTGSDTITYTVTDGTSVSAPATVTIDIVIPSNDAPVADDQSLTTEINTPVSITLTGSDADGDTLSYDIDSVPANGSLSGTAPNLTYTPAVDYIGSDSFTFVVNDGTVDSAPATVTIEVTDVATAMLIHADSMIFSLSSAGRNWKANVLITVVDQDGEPVSGATVSGTWSADGENLGVFSGITDLNGEVVLTSTPAKVKSGAEFAFELTAIAFDGAEYVPGEITSGSITVQ